MASGDLIQQEVINAELVAKQTKEELNQIKEKIAKEENVKKDSTTDNNNNSIDTAEPWLCVLGLQQDEELEREEEK